MCEERSESRRGLHKMRRIPLVIRGEKAIIADGSRSPAHPLYAVGRASEISLEPRDNELYVQVDLVMNPKRRVKGFIEIYDSEGRLLIRAKYEKLKLRLSTGNPRYGRLVELVARSLNIPYKNVNWHVHTTSDTVSQ
ncbi:MAG TPA: hypothetical protein VNL13_06375 [Sulfolobales archaeon]|nr:hypothetical protein [Sulfolobales archaeon]